MEGEVMNIVYECSNAQNEEGDRIEGSCGYNPDSLLDEIERLKAEVKELSEADGLPNQAALHVHAIKTIAEQRDTIKRLQAVIQPFAAVAKGIPDNWPERCRLRIDRENGVEFLNYHPSESKCRRILPTLGEWRTLRLIASIQIPESEQP